MYQELAPKVEALAKNLHATLPLDLGQVDRSLVIKAMVQSLTLYVGVDVANLTFAAVVNRDGNVLAELADFTSDPAGFARFVTAIEGIRRQEKAQIVLVSLEAAGVYYEEQVAYLKAHTDFACVLFNPRTTAHMAQVVGAKVRTDLVDAYLLSEQVRLGSTAESHPPQEQQVLIGRECSRLARDIAQEINAKKNQSKALVRRFNPALYRQFPGPTLYHPAVIALARQYFFPEEIVTAGVEKIAQILADNSAQRFGPVHTQALVQACQAQSGKEGMREVIRQRALELMEDILRLTQRKKDYLTMGYKTLRKVSIAKTLRQVPGFGRSNTLAVLTGVGLNVDRWPDGDHLASFLGLTTSKHISGVTLHVSTHITKQGDPNPRYALVNAADHLRREVPFYKATYTRVKAKKGKDGGHYTALCAIARHFAANVLYDMIKTGRPFFVQTEDYRRYRQQQRDAALVARQLPAAG
jgi:transposase